MIAQLEGDINDDGGNDAIDARRSRTEGPTLKAMYDICCLGRLIIAGSHDNGHTSHNNQPSKGGRGEDGHHQRCKDGRQKHLSSPVNVCY